MKALKIAAVVLGGLLLLIVGGSAWILNTLISGGAKDRLIAQASAALGVPVTVESYAIDFSSLLRLQPAITVQKLGIGSPPQFGAGKLLEADQVTIRLDLQDALNRKLHITGLEIGSPRILVQIPARGPSNLEALVTRVPASPSQAAPAEPGQPIEVRVDQVALINGTVTVESALTPQPQTVLRAVDLTLGNLVAGRPANLSLRTRLFESASSQMEVNGTVGPFGASLPLDAKAVIALAPTELPKALLTRFLGDLSSAPGPNSRLRLELALRGVAEGQINGQGTMSFQEFLVGGTGGAGRLALSGQAPLALSAEKLLSAAAWSVRSAGAKLKLGSGEWQGNLVLNRRGAALAGSVDGAIRGVDVNEMLTSFAGLPGQVQGVLTMPRFALRFTGAQPKEIQASLTGDGQLAIEKGQAKALDVLSAIENALSGRSSGAKGSFEQLATEFTVRSQVMQLTGIRLRAPGVNVTGDGTVGFDEALNLRLQTQIADSAASALGSLAGRYLGDPIVVGVNVGGTVSQPLVKADTGRLMKNAALGVADRLLKDAPEDSAAGAVRGILGGLFGRKKASPPPSDTPPRK